MTGRPERTGLSGVGRLLWRLHDDQSGRMLEYAMVFAFISIPLMVPFWPVEGEVRSIFGMLFDVLSDYFGMIAFYVTWPFL